MSAGDSIRDGLARLREKKAEALGAFFGDRAETPAEGEGNGEAAGEASPESEQLGYGPHAPAADAPWTDWWAHFQEEAEREQARPATPYPGSIDAGARSPEGRTEAPSMNALIRGQIRASHARAGEYVDLEADAERRSHL